VELGNTSNNMTKQCNYPSGRKSPPSKWTKAAVLARAKEFDTSAKWSQCGDRSTV